MKTKKFSKLLSLLLAIVLVVGMMPATALAADPVPLTVGSSGNYATVTAALAAASDGDTIQLLDDITESVSYTVSADKTVTIDGNNNAITGNNGTNGAALDLNGTGTINLENITLQGGAYDSLNSGAALLIGEGSIITVANLGAVDCISGTPNESGFGGCALWNSGSGVVNVTSATGTAENAVGVRNEGAGTVNVGTASTTAADRPAIFNIGAGTVNADRASATSGIAVWQASTSSGTVNVRSISISESGGTGVDMEGTGSVNAGNISVVDGAPPVIKSGSGTVSTGTDTAELSLNRGTVASCVLDSITVAKTGSTTIGSLPTVSKNGVAGKWYSDEEKSTEFSGTTVNGETTLYSTFYVKPSVSTEWDGTATDTAWYTDHETDTSFTIDTGAELAGLASLVNAGTDAFLGDTVTLGDDIDLDGHEWTPIGTLANPFKGTFDGDDCNITNLVIGTSGSYNATFIHAGLFGCTGGTSEIKDVNLVGAAIYAGAVSSTGTPAMVGGLVGNNGGTVKGCSVAGTVATTGTLNTGEAAYVGGIAGYSTGAFSGCTSAANVTGGNYVGAAGGIVGYTTVGITSCSTSGIVSVGVAHWDAPMAGGIVGKLYNRTDGTVKISNCHATGAVIGDDYTQLGGIAGSCEKEITDSYATGNVSGGTVSILGGLVGVGACPITNSYATGSVTGGVGSGAGGLAGITSNFAVSHCWASGNVSVDGAGSIGSNDGNAAGGLIGISNSNVISYCYATGNASGTDCFAGSLIGDNKAISAPKLTLTDCYAAGSAAGAQYYYGGLVSNGGGATMINCYWNSTLNAAAYGTGVVTGTPTGKTTAEMQTAAFAQLLTDGSGGNCSWVYNPSVNNGYPMISGVGNAPSAPVITSDNHKTVVSGAGSTFQVTASGAGTMAYSLSGSVPSGVSIDSSTGLMTIGAIDIGGFASTEYTFTVNANNGIDPAAAQSFTLTVVSKPVIHFVGFDNGTVGIAYEVTLPVTGVTPISWSVVSGSLPAGLSLSTDGIVSGTPTTAGTSTFSIKAENSVGMDIEQYSITVEAADISPAEALTNKLSGLGFTTAASGSAITVTGAQTATAGMTLTIPSGVTVLWKASLTGATSDSLIFLNGDGTFELASGEITNTGTGMALSSVKGSIVISGGTASSSNEVATVRTYYTPSAPTLTMTGGTVTSTSDEESSSAISAGGNTVITGGTVAAQSGKQVLLNNAVVVYRSGLLSKISSNSLSASIAVDQSRTYACPGETEGLTATGYSALAGHVTTKWAVLHPGEGTGVWVDYTYSGTGSGTWRVSYPDVKVVAYKQSLSYDANGGGNAATVRSTVYSGQTCTVSTNFFTRSGFNFTGWNTQADGKGTSYAEGATLTGTNSDDDIILYAQWSEAGSGGKSSGGSSGGSTPAPAAPSASVSGSTATTTVKPAIGTDGKATAAVTAEQMSDVLEKAQKASQTGNPLNVMIKVEGTSGVNSVAATIPSDSIKKLASGRISGMTVSGGLSDLTFSKDALKTISDTASGDVNVTASKVKSSVLSDAAKQAVGDRPVYEFSITSSGKTISEFGGNVTVSIPYTPAAGEDPGAIVLYYIAADGTLTMVPDARYDAATGRVVFTTTHFSTYAIGYNKVSFSDVADKAWYSEAVSYLAARGITSGTTSTTFGPNTVLTRGQFITMLLKAYGVAPNTNSGNNFADAGSTYYTGYLASAKQLGISDGIGGNLFAPDKAVTRQEMFTMLYNALKAIDKQPTATSGKAFSDFTDASNVAPWATDAMSALVKTGTISGSGGKLSPASTTTRAEMAQVLYNLQGK